MKASEWFERRSRDNGETFVTLKEDAPEWLRAAVYEAHDGSLPSDWVYDECFAAIQAAEDGSLTEDALGEHADSRVDIYTKARFAWAEEFCLSSLYSDAEETAEDCEALHGSVSDRIGQIQYFAIENIAAVMLRSYESQEE